MENVITTIYDYTLHGKLITHLTKRVVDLEGTETDKEELHFFYDAQSRPAFVEYEGSRYRYIYKLQGDIVAIVDAAGNPVVEYKYDAWGKPCSNAGYTDIGEFNPFRYRGYVWDEEVELYYLKSRFYSAERNRFISADGVSLPALIKVNLYQYGDNRPVNQIDYSGLSSSSATSNTYCVLLNVYDSVGMYKGTGHYDLSIIENSGRPFKVSWNGKSYECDGLTFSYGATTSEAISPARVNVYNSGERADLKDIRLDQLVLYDSLSHEDLEGFIKWFADDFTQYEKTSGKAFVFDVRDGAFSEYNYTTKNSYCGSGAMYMAVHIPNMVNPEKNRNAHAVCATAIYMAAAPRFVIDEVLNGLQAALKSR